MDWMVGEMLVSGHFLIAFGKCSQLAIFDNDYEMQGGKL